LRFGEIEQGWYCIFSLSTCQYNSFACIESSFAVIYELSTQVQVKVKVKHRHQRQAPNHSDATGSVELNVSLEGQVTGVPETVAENR
jgi:hypothetical protein